MSELSLLGFGDGEWGRVLLLATLMTLKVSLTGFAIGLAFGSLGAWAKLSRVRLAHGAASIYTTVFRGVPELLIIYIFYFGGTQAVSWLSQALFASDLALDAFWVGALAVAMVSGAYQTEVLRGAYHAIPKGELEAARVTGMSRTLLLRHILVPRILHFALPGIGNVWQLAIKESALISVIGLVEILRQAKIGAGVTGEPFLFYIAAGVLFLAVTSVSGVAFRWLERRTRRHLPKTQETQ